MVKNIAATLILFVVLIFTLHLGGALQITGVALESNSWLTWLGLFTLIAITLMLFRKPTRTNQLIAEFDTPIYTKPAFKVASLLVVILAFGILFV